MEASWATRSDSPRHALVGRLLPERLRRLQQMTGLPVVFGGAVESRGGRQRLVISRLTGTVGDALDGLVIGSGQGLGGAVLATRSTRRAEDYATDASITHDYDDAVRSERLQSVVAAPILVHGSVHGVIYGAVRDDHSIGGRTVRAVDLVATLAGRDVESRLRPQAGDEVTSPTAALDELAQIISSVPDLDLRRRLVQVHRDLERTQRRRPGAPMANLAPRELDALRLAGIGATNLAIAAELGLAPETVKSYLASAMRKLGASNRTEAVHHARTAGLLESI